MRIQIITSVDSMGISGTWRIYRDAAGNQIRREKFEPVAATREGAGPITAVHHRPANRAPRQLDTATDCNPGRPTITIEEREALLAPGIFDQD